MKKFTIPYHENLTAHERYNCINAERTSKDFEAI